MKTTFILASAVAALSGLTGFASTAHTGTDLSLRVGIGSSRQPAPVVIAPDCPPSLPAYGYTVRPDYRAPQGYWKHVVVRTWVPTRWTVSWDRRGRQIRTLQNGYYAERVDRVWVGYGRG